MQDRDVLYPPLWSLSQIYRALVAFPIATFTLTVVTDLAYLQTSNLLWLHFSEWLLFAGLVIGIVAAIYLGILCLVRRSRPSRLHALFGVVALILAALNSFIHTADGWTAVMPYGLATSIATVIAMLLASWFGSWRHRHN
ncbi:DUF2231 domain-containing protein [Mesorhizobium australicum]|uniref:Uncharacterized membrane protein n=1 Tax=Mesorhizobium australicum TaxID=536018 RepID=A0A1X7N0T4_9HYPH|nr:DUF2231 domain-containing protein [Mesorhizobium australicum]SMH29949.1 Uncharacterized membrane protein [Mesorhizobium australicum]